MPSSITANLHYAAPLVPGGPEDDWVLDGISRAPDMVLNFRMVPTEVNLVNMRHSDIRPKLDDMGFEYMSAALDVDQLALAHGSARELEQYQRQTAALLKSATGADDVVFFDATQRCEDGDSLDVPLFRRAATRVHIDQNPASARARAVNHGGPERRYSRFQIVNLWRPLIAPVRNFPLALCDYRSVDLAADLRRAKVDFPPWLKDRENYQVKSNPGHRWYYWDALQPDEMLLFKCYDSACRDLALLSEGVARQGLMDVAGLCPHTAFFDPAGPTDGRLRTSLEMRVLLFYD